MRTSSSMFKGCRRDGWPWSCSRTYAKDNITQAHGQRSVGDFTLCGMLPPTGRRPWASSSRSLPLPMPCIESFRLLSADEAVAVRVDGAELPLGAEPFAAGDIAVAVPVHLAEPEGAGGRL